MMRGFRWQFLALIAAVVVFTASLIARPSSGEATPTPQLDFTIAPSALHTAAPVDASTAEAAQIPVPALTPDTQPEPGLQAPIFREALVGSVQRLNPLFSTLNPVDRDITSLIFEGLFRSNAYGEPLPQLASEWIISFDGLEYVIFLREDVLWQDGIPFNADDVIYTMSILSDPAFPGPPELGAFWRTVETEKLGEHVVRFRLAQPLGSFLDALHIGILPYHALRGSTAAQLVDHPFNLTPVGTGPYQLEAIRSQGERIAAVDLRAAPVYRQRAEGQTGYAIDRLRFFLFESAESATAALQAGTVDAYATRDRSERAQMLTLDASVIPHTGFEPTVGTLIFNYASDRMAVAREIRFRQGLFAGLDRASIVNRNLANYAVLAESPMMRLSWAYTSDLPWPAYNLTQAQTLISQIDFSATGPEATPEATPDVSQTPALFSFNLLVPQDEALIRLADEIAEQWSLLGLEVTVQAAHAEQYLARLEAGDFDTAIVELSKEGTADPDLYSFWHQGQYPDGLNYGGINDSTLSSLLERARRDASGINRIQLYTEFQITFAERAAAMPLYNPLFTYAVRSRVSGVQLGYLATPADRFRSIQDWQIGG
jgi:peptide/nickel transport system substrate-binding protein